MTFNESTDLRRNKLVLVIADFAGYSQAFSRHDDLTMATFMNQFYSICVDTTEEYGGRIVKFMGDACFAVFEGDAGLAAVNAVLALQRVVHSLTTSCGIDVRLGARVHCGIAVEGRYGPAGHSRYDVLGTEVNKTVMMGGGADVWISQPVYEQLDNRSIERWKASGPSGPYRYMPSQRDPEMSDG